MAIRSFTFEPDLIEAFIRFGYDIYRNDDQWIPPLRQDLYRQFAPDFPFYATQGNSHRHFLAAANGNIIGRVSAMVNTSLRDTDGTPVGSVGFFESVDEYAVACDLLGEARTWLHGRGIKRIWGPMNFDIWHNYRFMTSGFDQEPFLGEPYNKPYYHEFFEQYGFTARQYWDSVELIGRRELEDAANQKRRHLRDFVARGYRFVDLDLSHIDDELVKLHRVLVPSFNGFLGFTPISVVEFQQLFTAARHAFRPGLFVLVHDENNELIGFAGAFVDLARAVRAMKSRTHLLSRLNFLMNRRRSDRILFYLGGILPTDAIKRAGIGRAGFCHIMDQIVKAGFEKVVVALMARGNKVQGMLKENNVAARKEYALYQLDNA